MRRSFKLHGLALRMAARHGDAARGVAYSRALSARRAGSDRRSGMWLEVVRLIAAIRPGVALARGHVRTEKVVPLRAPRRGA
jgi:hypothetical protein